VTAEPDAPRRPDRGLGRDRAARLQPIQHSYRDLEKRHQLGGAAATAADAANPWAGVP